MDDTDSQMNHVSYEGKSHLTFPVTLKTVPVFNQSPLPRNDMDDTDTQINHASYDMSEHVSGHSDVPSDIENSPCH